MIRILVTGCQRSSTRHYAKYLAAIFGITYIDEDKYSVRDYAALQYILKKSPQKNEGWCIHGPGLKAKVKEIKADYPDVHVIWMKRDTEETVLSMNRIAWRKSLFSEWTSMVPVLYRLGLSIELWNSLYRVIIEMAGELGKKYEERGLVTVVDMQDIEGIEGFKKSSVVSNVASVS